MTPSLPTPPPDDPLPIAMRWLAEATARARRNPNAMALATVDANGHPSARMVLLKELVPAGYGVFYTNYGSRKGHELDATGRAAGVLHWDELGRQLRFEGAIVRSPAAESDAYFASRAWRSQLNAWSSEQSRPIDDPAELEQRASTKAREFGASVAGQAQPSGVRLPRPAFWGGYRLWFDAIELWAEGADRFHERLSYHRELGVAQAYEFHPGPWSWQRLQP
ncbi:MAG: pyridoxamine 5'-phosphate oxidase [Gammaproteobacteria bacterium]